jgi:hypothetical protein
MIRDNPKAEIAVWSDMLILITTAARTHTTRSTEISIIWNHIPKDLIIAVWGRNPSEFRAFPGADSGRPAPPTMTPTT